jgi:hypothetical protein
LLASHGRRIVFQTPGVELFTTLGAASGFWQIPLEKAYYTFLTPHGRFRFARLSFGLISGSEMQQCLKESQVFPSILMI